MSVPVVVTVHGNQQCEAEATVFWENAFAEKVRDLFRLTRSLNSLKPCIFLLGHPKCINKSVFSYFLLFIS